jgi:hypothetical protein
MGLMQVMPSWFHSGENPWNPGTNINKGTQILRRCKDQAGGWHPGDEGWGSPISASTVRRDTGPSKSIVVSAGDGPVVVPSS